MLWRVFSKNNPETIPSQCLDFFNQRDELQDKFWESLGHSHPACECELVSVSAFSPGPVCDDETILSVVTSSSYVTQDGHVEPTLFESRISNGISTDRRIHTNLIDYSCRSAALVVGNDKKSDCGSIELQVGKIRDISYNEMQAIAVYDTALEDNIAHAEIACSEVPADGTLGRKKLRAELRKKILDACLHDGKVVPASDLFKSN